MKALVNGTQQCTMKTFEVHLSKKQANLGVWYLMRHRIMCGALLTVLDYPREQGIASNDIMSYLPSQKEWVQIASETGPIFSTGWNRKASLFRICLYLFKSFNFIQLEIYIIKVALSST